MRAVLVDEETQFRRTLERGLVQFVVAKGAGAGGVLSGLDVWRLYDTYGFPGFDPTNGRRARSDP